ncbi:hypothetical protein LFML04_2253 [Leptospirillum ferriphilum ML-04]|uniref:Uncharacterized protein n=1 Tax=Leptospirillum ferriphilum (strain ML-04) TaxID=1048260 RepID=J9ZDG5_LEPFM|nr:hypothetical protein LFML04_2253 [Leptospirillum ferriphilum ML-04]
MSDGLGISCRTVSGVSKINSRAVFPSIHHNRFKVSFFETGIQRSFSIVSLNAGPDISLHRSCPACFISSFPHPRNINCSDPANVIREIVR